MVQWLHAAVFNILHLHKTLKLNYSNQDFAQMFGKIYDIDHPLIIDIYIDSLLM